MTCWCGKPNCTRREAIGQQVAGLSCVHEWRCSSGAWACAKCGATCRRDERGRIVEYTAPLSGR